MAYCTQADIENVFGAPSVKVWSNLVATATAVDTARVAAAIAWAEYTINSKFAGSPYTVPFGTVNVVITDWAAKLAGVWLFQSRRPREGEGGDAEGGVGAHEQWVMDQIGLYLCGARRFYDLSTANRTPMAPHFAE
ncbi:MAG: phage protein Gp36 family protein [bacterium]